ncbi:MAG: hypothetical protein ACI92W_001492 [Paraglaciecola sp.]|jgi:hypothetical protein
MCLICCLSITSVFGQNRALTRPFKYLKPTAETDASPDTRKSPFLWTVFIDREGTEVYKDKNLKNAKEEIIVAFMDRFIVADESDESMLLYVDPNIDSVTFSSQAEEIGWVDKKNLVLWDKFMWGDQLTRMLALSSWSKVDNQSADLKPNRFEERPSSPSRFFIFNVVKFDKESQNVLLSLRTFNNRNKDLFCWVPINNVMLVNDRNGYIPNREFILDFGGNNPSIYNSVASLLTKDRNGIAHYIDSLRTDEGFFDQREDLIEKAKKIKWIDNEEILDGFLQYEKKDNDEGKFKKGIIVNRQEFSIMKKAIETLSESRSKEDYKNRWKQLYEDNNMSFFESMGQYDLFEELVQFRFNYDEQSDGSTVDEIAFMKDSDFDLLKQSLEESMLSLISAESDSDYPYNFAPFSYPHYWLPLEVLPLRAFEVEYNVMSEQGSSEQEEVWNYENIVKDYETFDIFYIDNSHDYNSSFDLKDQVIRSFYRKAARIRETDPSKGSVIFYSNIRSPMIGAGEKFTESVAGMMRESASGRPNRRVDKKLLRSSVYAKNINSVERLTFHFYVGEKFYNEAIQSSRWLLKDLVTELHIELKAKNTEVILYKLDPEEDEVAFIQEINSTEISGLSYRITRIEF